MKLVVGLGNPGEQYAGARHNVGFMVVEMLARTVDAEFKLDKKSNVEVAKGKLAGKPVVLAKPQAFVNKSGDAVKLLVKNLKIKKLENLVVVHDDLDIEFGNFKLSFGKNSGGHRGVESISKALKSKAFWRLKIGTANVKLAAARRHDKVADFVLAEFTPSEQDALKQLIKQAIVRLSLTL